MTQNLHIALTVDGVDIEAAVPVPTDPAPRRVLLPILQSLTDTVVNIAEQSAAAQGHAVSCKKGCDACCRQMVPISPTEAYALAAHLDTLPPSKAAKFLERFDEGLDTLDQKCLLDRLLKRHTLSPAALQQLDRDYFAARIACPFLENKACAIHPVRPLACREFLVSSPPRNCRNPTADKVAQIPMPAKVSLALAKTDTLPWLPLILARQFVAKYKEKTPKQPPAKLLTDILQAL